MSPFVHKTVVDLMHNVLEDNIEHVAPVYRNMKETLTPVATPVCFIMIMLI